MVEKARCEICNKGFSSLEGLEHHNKAKHSESVEKEARIKTKKKIGSKQIIWIAISVLVVLGIYMLVSGGETFPPTTMKGHVEVNPPSHVMKEPMRIEVQKHMLEHADGEDIPGIIINYNCVDYECELGLITKLEKFAEIYPENVYVAPFKNMDAKIVLTKLNRIEILETYDESKIHIFISGGVPINEDPGITTSTDTEQNQTENESVETTNIKEFSVTAKQWEFIPNEITVNEGDTVKLNIKSVDVNHGFSLREFGVNELLSPGNTVNIEFVADKKGEFTFFCNVQCGAGHTSMRGKLIVE